MQICIYQIIFTLLHIHAVSVCVPERRNWQETFSFCLLMTHPEGRTVASVLRLNKTPQKTHTALKSPSRTGTQTRKTLNCCVNRIRQRANCLDFMLVYRTDNVVRSQCLFSIRRVQHPQVRHHLSDPALHHTSH